MLFDSHVHLSHFEPGNREEQIATAKSLGTTTSTTLHGKTLCFR